MLLGKKSKAPKESKRAKMHEMQNKTWMRQGKGKREP